MNKIVPHFYKILIPQHLLFFVGLILIVLGYISPWYLLFSLLGYVVLGYIGSSIFLHRYWCHNTFKTYPWIARIGVWLGGLAGIGAPLSYYAIHINLHHPHSDTDNDPHTPFKGRLHAWMTWQNQPYDQFSKTYGKMIRPSRKLLEDKFMVFLQRNYFKVWWGSLLIFSIINWKFALFFMLGGGVVYFHIEGFINAFCHNNNNGYINGDSGDKSVNHKSKLMMYLSLGNTLHHNHHLEPWNYSQKLKKGEFDLAHYLIPLIKLKD